MWLRFRLSDRSFYHESTKDENKRRLIFSEAWKVYGKLTVVGKGELNFGSAVIHEGPAPEIEFATISYIAMEKTVQERTSHHCFNIHAHITSDTFNYLLNMDEDRHCIELALDFSLGNENIKWDTAGWDDDSGDICWDTLGKDTWFNVANSVSIRLSKIKK
jgi:hypothetical protein